MLRNFKRIDKDSIECELWVERSPTFLNRILCTYLKILTWEYPIPLLVTLGEEMRAYNTLTGEEISLTAWEALVISLYENSQPH